MKLDAHPLRTLVWLCLLPLLATSCVTRQPHGPGADTARTESPGAAEAGGPQTTPRETKGPITLVIGGAGVASFATVGLLKKFHEEGVRIEAIIATGWPALFATGYGLMRTVHDLEWFAMKLEPSDFFGGSLFGANKGFAEHQRIQAVASKAFGTNNLGQTRLPIVLSTSNSQTGAPEVFSSGAWLDPLSKALSVPGTFRPYGEGPGLGWTSSLAGVDVDEAERRGAKNIVAISMYEDYLTSLQDSRIAETETLYRNLFAAQLQKNIRANLKRAVASAQLRLARSPGDFGAKRLAIQLGYQEAGKIVRSLSNRAN